jgi:hypothetical protein
MSLHTKLREEMELVEVSTSNALAPRSNITSTSHSTSDKPAGEEKSTFKTTDCDASVKMTEMEELELLSITEHMPVVTVFGASICGLSVRISDHSLNAISLSNPDLDDHYIQLPSMAPISTSPSVSSKNSIVSRSDSGTFTNQHAAYPTAEDAYRLPKIDQLSPPSILPSNVSHSSSSVVTFENLTALNFASVGERELREARLSAMDDKQSSGDESEEEDVNDMPLISIRPPAASPIICRYKVGKKQSPNVSNGAVNEVVHSPDEPLIPAEDGLPDIAANSSSQQLPDDESRRTEVCLPRQEADAAPLRAPVRFRFKKLIERLPSFQYRHRLRL